jgi:hypothetical protein
MQPVIIENPILNSPFREPDRHFRFDDTGITNETVSTRRPSAYFIPIPKPRKSNQKQLILQTEWTESQREETKLVNDIRVRVGQWRQGGYVGVTPLTARLLNTGPTLSASASSFSARSRRSKPSYTSPKSPTCRQPDGCQNGLRTVV